MLQENSFLLECGIVLEIFSEVSSQGGESQADGS